MTSNEIALLDAESGKLSPVAAAALAGLLAGMRSRTCSCGSAVPMIVRSSVRDIAYLKCQACGATRKVPRDRLL